MAGKGGKREEAGSRVPGKRAAGGDRPREAREPVSRGVDEEGRRGSRGWPWCQRCTRSVGGGTRAGGGERARVRGTRCLSCATTNPVFTPGPSHAFIIFSSTRATTATAAATATTTTTREPPLARGFSLSLSLSLFLSSLFFRFSAPTRLRTPLLNYFKPLSRCNMTTHLARRGGGRRVVGREQKTCAQVPPCAALAWSRCRKHGAGIYSA